MQKLRVTLESKICRTNVTEVCAIARMGLYDCDALLSFLLMLSSLSKSCSWPYLMPFIWFSCSRRRRSCGVGTFSRPRQLDEVLSTHNRTSNCI